MHKNFTIQSYPYGPALNRIPAQKFFGAAVGLGFTLVFGACQPEPQRVILDRSASREPALRGSQSNPTAPAADGPAASIQGMPVDWRELAPALAEVAGKQILEEAALDRALERLAQERGVVVGAREVEAERERLLASIATDSGLEGGRADRALAHIRESRGLGPVRFARLLERNARLRALVAEDAVPTPEEISRETELILGTKVAAVVLLVSNEKEAATLRAAMMEAPGPGIERLSAMAAARSIDGSASHGGRVGPIHPSDPRVTAGLRPILESLPVGELSPVIATDDAYAIVMVESRSEPVAPTPESEAKILAMTRAKVERLAMERLARRLIGESVIVARDPSLRWNMERGGE